MASSSGQHAVYHSLLQSFHRTKTHLSLTNLNNPHITENPEIFSTILQKTTKKLQTTKQLKKLTLDLKGAQLSPKNLKVMSQYLLKNLRDIENLKIILNPKHTFQNQSFELLLKALRTFRCLRIFEVAIPKWFEDISKKHLLSDLTKVLKKSSPRLQEVKFSFLDQNHQNTNDKGLPLLKQWRLNQIGNIQKLTLHLPQSVFVDQGNLDLSSLRRIKRLKSLDITLFRLSGDGERTEPRRLAFDASVIFPNLKQFKWSFLSKSLNKRNGTELFGAEIATQLYRSIEDFGLRFEQNSEFYHRNLKDTLQILTSLGVNLNQLSVLFNNNELTYPGDEDLIFVLTRPRLQNMQTLSLEFMGCKGINCGFVEKMARTIQNMKKLRSLRLSFGFSNTSILSGVRPLPESDFRADREVIKLGEILSKGCENLELISLEFLGYSHISDRGVMSLCRSLSQIQSLNTVRLILKFCPKVSSESRKCAKEKFGPQRDVKFTLI